MDPFLLKLPSTSYSLFGTSGGPSLAVATETTADAQTSVASVPGFAIATTAVFHTFAQPAPLAATAAGTAASEPSRCQVLRTWIQKEEAGFPTPLLPIYLFVFACLFLSQEALARACSCQDLL